MGLEDKTTNENLCLQTLTNVITGVLLNIYSSMLYNKYTCYKNVLQLNRTTTFPC